MSKPRPQILFIEEVAARTRVPVKTLRHWRLHGTGPKSARMGRRVVYREADVEAWVDAQFEEGPRTS
ncbi:helix-turn-helix transcriptional regulator [Pimelobacter simplex]|uniref:helix-turn-helix transcriptional regulator n=1 Tax=Nocardioides simplex TaxID=2045 RepID=UPI003AAFC8B7